MASPTPALVGDYYGRHDHCLYRISWAHESYWQARCTSPSATPAEDVFGPAYPTTEAQLRWLLAFGSFIPALDFVWPAHPATTPSTSTIRLIFATTAG